MAGQQTVLIATTPRGVMVRGAVNMNSVNTTRTPGVIRFSDGTVILVNGKGRMILAQRGKADVAITSETDCDRAVVTGSLSSIRVNLGGNIQEANL